MPAREDISDLRAGVRFWLFLNGVDSNAAMGICHYALAENAGHMSLCISAVITLFLSLSVEPPVGSLH